MKNFILFNFKLFKFFDKKELRIITKNFISSFVIVTFFYVSPLIINLVDKSNLEFQNNSKAVACLYFEQGK